jgi:hypothetical protein
VTRGWFTVPVTDVALFETNVVHELELDHRLACVTAPRRR